MPSYSSVFQKLVDNATLRTIIGYPDEMRLGRAIRDGKPIPEVCKPGYLLNSLSEDERKVLTSMTSSQISGFGERMMNDIRDAHQNYLLQQNEANKRLL